MTTRRIRFLIVFCWLLVFIPFTAFSGENTYVASRFSILYHLSTCKKAKRIQVRNRVTFTLAEKAVEAGYHPCTKCKPPTKD